MKKLTPHKKSLRNTGAVFAVLLTIEVIIYVIPGLFQEVNPHRISDGFAKGGKVMEKTILEPFVCIEWLGMGEGTYEYYCSIIGYLFTFPRIAFTIFLVMILIVGSIVTYLSSFIYFKLTDSKKHKSKTS